MRSCERRKTSLSRVTTCANPRPFSRFRISNDPCVSRINKPVIGVRIGASIAAKTSGQIVRTKS